MRIAKTSKCRLDARAGSCSRRIRRQPLGLLRMLQLQLLQIAVYSPVPHVGRTSHSRPLLPSGLEVPPWLCLSHAAVGEVTTVCFSQVTPIRT